MECTAPLSYVEDDVQLPVLTLSSYLFQRSNLLPEKEPWREETVFRREPSIWSHVKIIIIITLWNRWSKEYHNALGDLIPKAKPLLSAPPEPQQKGQQRESS